MRERYSTSNLQPLPCGATRGIPVAPVFTLANACLRLDEILDLSNHVASNNLHRLARSIPHCDCRLHITVDCSSLKDSGTRRV